MDMRATPLSEPCSAPGPCPAIKVGVLVDLAQGARAGGHVRCWERLAEAALSFPDRLDLTVHFMGERPARARLGATVRYVIEPPVFGTERLRFLSHVPGHTDLAPFHPRLARMLPGYDVIHATDAYFAYARTALGVGRRHGIPIVNSVHTNTPEYARLFTGTTIERMFGKGVVARVLLDRLRLTHCVERHMAAQLAAYQRRCAFTLVSRADQLAEARARLTGRAGLLRRGVDHRLFHPAKRNRQRLATRYGIPPDRFILICAGRLNRAKNVLFLAEAMAGLIARGIDPHLICAGDGEDRAAILDLLEPRATCPGSVDPSELARLYAAADLFAFPSRIEESANVVREALASGLPVLVAHDGGMGHVVAEGRAGLVLSGDDPAPWIAAAADLAARPELRRVMGGAARRHAERTVPSWADVLSEDLLPRREDAALRRSQVAAAA
jgi:glycosyltransferase involved in cell wall biosynthesis